MQAQTYELSFYLFKMEHLLDSILVELFLQPEYLQWSTIIRERTTLSKNYGVLACDRYIKTPSDKYYQRIGGHYYKND